VPLNSDPKFPEQCSTDVEQRWRFRPNKLSASAGNGGARRPELQPSLMPA
jgi:hypothetical protein